jgi:flagellar biosynthesis/type III secretory pathway M-ring protein FliF/YscJ
VRADYSPILAAPASASAAQAAAEISGAAPPPLAAPSGAPAQAEDNAELSERVRLVAKREPDLAANVLRMWLQESKT